MSKVTLNNKRDVKSEVIILLMCLATASLLVPGFVKLTAHMERRVESNPVEFETERNDEEAVDETDVDVVENEIEEVTYCCDSPIHNYTSEEILLLACAVYAEAGNCSEEHQIFVASVIMNRVESESYPNTIYEVIHQTKPCLQYACTKNGMLEKAMEKYNGDCTDYEFDFLERTYQNVLYVLENGSVLPEDVIYQAEFKQGSGVYKKIGNTYFCYQ